MTCAADLSTLLSRRLSLPAVDDVDLGTRLEAALHWIRRAHAKVREGGISKGHDVLRGRWLPSYPETTGYTIPTLLNVQTRHGCSDLGGLALSLAEYLLGVATPEGGISHWAGSTPAPVAFDTGQVIFGWLAAFRESGDDRFQAAAARAGHWLASVQHPSGSWQRHQHLGVEKVIDTRVSWALLELHRLNGDERCRGAAVKNLEWALTRQDPDGWFPQCGFSPGEDPFTHTLAYTAEGLLECGILLNEPRLVLAARRTADALLACQQPDGRLESTYGAGWRATSRSSCLTGNCQMSRLWMRLADLTGQPTYSVAARKAIAFVSRTQELRTCSPDIRGGIAGSYPIYGRYERFKYPNWAAKFFIDAVLAVEPTLQDQERFMHAG